MVFVPGLDVKGLQGWEERLLVFSAVCIRGKRARAWKTGGRKSGGELTGKEGGYGVPALTHILRPGEDENLETGIKRVDAMIEQFAQGTALFRSSTVPHHVVVSQRTPSDSSIAPTRRGERDRKREKTHACAPSTASNV